MDVHGKINPVRVEETCEVDDLRNRIIPALLNLGSIRGSLILPNGRRLEGKKTLKEEGINNKGKFPVILGINGHETIQVILNNITVECIRIVSKRKRV